MTPLLDVFQESLSEAITAENKKCCADCKTTKTPLWRGGPTGPKVLSFISFSRFFISRNGLISSCWFGDFESLFLFFLVSIISLRLGFNFDSWAKLFIDCVPVNVVAFKPTIITQLILIFDLFWVYYFLVIFSLFQLLRFLGLFSWSLYG